jgi:hypothetical protein
VRELDFETAIELATSLTLIKECPRFQAVLGALAEDLMCWCANPVTVDGVTSSPYDQAAWLVSEARRTWHKWTSMADLYDLYQAKFHPKSGKSENFPPRCSICGDSGTVTVGGLFQWCQCLAARSIRIGDPDLVTRLNTVPTPRTDKPPEQPRQVPRRGGLASVHEIMQPAGENRPLITQAEIDAAVHELREKKALQDAWKEARGEVDERSTG